MPMAFRQKPGWDYEPVTDDRECGAQPTTQYERDMVAKNNCPRCREKTLDTGWECTECGYDAMPIALELEANK